MPLKKLVLFYLYTFLVLDTIMGFLLVFLGLKDQLIVNPGQLVRSTLLILFLTVLIQDAFKKMNSLNSRILLGLLYFGLFAMVVFLKNDPELHWLAEVDNAAKLTFIILLFYYINKHQYYFMSHLEKIMLMNFWVLTANLFTAYFTGVGIATYGEGLASTKGFLYGGNAVSILSLVFFVYYFFKIRTDSKAKYLCSIAVFNIYIVGTKAIFIVPVVMLIYLATKVKWTPVKIGISLSIALPVIISGLIIVQPLITQLYHYKYAGILKNTGVIASSGDPGAKNVTEALLVYRRTAFAIEQVGHQFSDADGLLFGYGNSGQNKFWDNQSYGGRFRFAGMDFIDFLFEYGIIGSLLIYSFIFYAFYFVVKQWQFTALTVSFIFIFLYSFFGGYVLYGSTAGTMFALLTALVYPQKNFRKPKLRKRIKAK